MSESNFNNHITVDDLSAFADGQIADLAERERIEQHLATCPECRQDLDELRTISQLLSNLPEPELPRSFRLSLEDIPESPVPEPAPIEPWIIRNQSRFRVAAMAAVLLLAVVVTIDLLPAGTDDVDEAPVTMMEEAAEEPADDPVEEAAPEADEPDAGIMGVDEDDTPVSEEDEPAVEPEADSPEEDREQDAAAPVDDADVEEAEDRAVAPAEEETDDEVSETRDVATAAEDPDGVSTLRIVAILLGVVTAILLAAGFIIPRWWQSSARR